MNYLYAKLNKEAEKLKYKGVNTATVNMNVDNKNYTISADVKNVHDSRIPELTGEESFCVPFVNEAGTAFQIGSIPAACLNTNCVTTEKVANSAITTDKLNDGAVTEVKLSNGVLDKIPYGADNEFAHGVRRINNHIISAVSEPSEGAEGNYGLNTIGWNYDTDKQTFLDSKPTFVVLRCNILGIVGEHATRVYGSNLILNEVSRTIPTGDTSNLYEIVFEGIYGNFKYTFKEVFQHMVMNGMSIISVPDSYTCKREFIANTNTIADGSVTTDKLAFHLYQHVIYLDKYRLRFYLFNSTSKPYTKVGDLPDFGSIPASGSYAAGGQTVENNIITAVSQQNEALTIEGVTTNSGQYIIAMEQPTTSIVDTVTQLI